MNSNSIWLLNRKTWDFLNPDPAAIDWNVVALVLARIGRWGGHTTQGPYSVAQHLVEGARAVLRETGRKDWAGAYLLHDVHEFVIGDDVRPKVEALAILAGEAASLVPDEWTRAAAAKWLKAAFTELKRRADAVIYPAAGLAWPLSPEAEAVVKQFDNRMLRTEADARTGPRVAPWAAVVEDACPVEGADCSPWSAELAASLWMGAARELLPALRGDGSVPAPAEAECDCCDPCSKCGATSGGDWSQCDEHCPLPMSPHYKPSFTEASLVPKFASGGWHDPGLPEPVRTSWMGAARELRAEFPAFDAACRPFDGELDTDALKARGTIKDWCDWADGSRPGTCTACGGVFGMLHAPSVCLRGPR